MTNISGLRTCVYGLAARVHVVYYARARQRPLQVVHEMASFGICSRGGPRSTVDMYDRSMSVHTYIDFGDVW